MKNVIKKSLFAVLAIAVIGIACFAFTVSRYVTASAEQTRQKSSVSASVQTAAELEDMGFTLINDGTEYRVRAVNKQMTEADIPATYNGKPVTEIAANGFMSCRNLKNVYVPTTVKVLGASAFYGCTALERVWGGASLESIGNNAFANCTKLRYFRIPKSIETMGSTVFRNNPNEIYVRMYEEEFCSLSAVSSTWSSGRGADSTIIYGHDLICEPVDENDYTKGFLLLQSYDYEALDDADAVYEFLCSYEITGEDGITHKYPVVGIESYAFELREFQSLTIKYDPDIDNGFTVDIGTGVFMNTFCQSIKVEVNIEFYDIINDCESTDQFVCSTATEIVLPENTDKIPYNCFVGCESLASFIIPDSVETIGGFAFSDCFGMERIDIPSGVTEIGECVFMDWGLYTEQTICFDAVKPPENIDAVPWDDGIVCDRVNMIFETVTVELDANGGSGGTQSVQAMYGRLLPNDVEAPQAPSAIIALDGFYSTSDGTGEMYYDGDMTPVKKWGDYEIDNLTKLYAVWTAKTFAIRLDFCGGEGDCDVTNVTYNDIFPDLTCAPEKFGYTFAGYYTAENGGGVMIYGADMQSVGVRYDDISVTTLYAAWTPVKYRVDLNLDGGTSGTAYVLIAYMTKDVYSSVGQAIPNIEIPVKQHYTFGGFFKGNVRYFSEDGECVHAWDMEEDTLTAKWEAIKYGVTYVDYLEEETPTKVSIDDILQSENGYIYSEEVTKFENGRMYTWAPIKLDINNFYRAEVRPSSREATLSECYDKESGSYKIWYFSQFDAIRDHVNSMTNTIIKNYELMADIEINNEPEFGYGDPESWIPLPRFAGSFNGHSHTVSGLYINASTVGGYYGLFFSNSGTISRLNVKGSITLTGSGEVYAGLLCGRNTGRIETCQTSSDDGYGMVCDIETSYVGGAVGYNGGILYHVFNSAGISGKGNIGGIVGRNAGDKNTSFVSGAANSGNILYQCTYGNASVGGIAGVTEGGTIEVCTTAGTITVKGMSAIEKRYMPCIGSVIGTLYSANTVYGTQMSRMGIDTFGTNALTTYIGGEIGRQISSLGI